MPLRFLVPAFLAGLLALAIPILVHLTRKQRAKVVEFPSLLFLEQVPFQDESRRTIQHWLLLLLRALAVILIVAAFARPFFRDAEVGGSAGSGPREVVILVDRSYSMGVGNRWEGARDAARGAIRGMGPLDRASLVFFARNTSVAVRSTGDRDRLLAALDTATVSDESTAYGPGLKLAQTILEETELPGRELVLVGDFQRGGWMGEEGVRLPPGTVVTPVSLASPPPANRSVSEVTLPWQRRDGRDRVAPTARMTRVGGEGEEVVQVILEMGGREVQRLPVILPADGAATLIFDPVNVSREHTQGAVRFAEADELVPDDVYHFVLSPGRSIGVLVLDAGGRAGASSLFLTEALAVSERSEFEVTVRAGTGPSPSDLEEASVVVVNDRALPGGDEAEALRGFVEDGGGLLVVMGDRFRWPSALADLLPGAYTEPVDRRDGRGGRLGYLDYDHPVFEIFRGPRSGDFTRARFFRARDLQSGDDASVRVLARYDDGSVALAEKSLGKGRILAWTSTLDAYWNDLAQQPVFLPFAHQLVRYASGRAEVVSAFAAGQILNLTDPTAMATAGLEAVQEALAQGEDRVALTPSGETRILSGGDGSHYLHLDRQGVYQLRPPGGSDVRPLAVAVNVDLREADLTPLDVEEVVAAISAVSSEVEGARREGSSAVRLRSEDQERRQSLWRFLLLAAAVFLAVETLVSNRISKFGGRRGIHAGS